MSNSTIEKEIEKSDEIIPTVNDKRIFDEIIENDNFDHTHELTTVTDEIAKKLFESPLIGRINLPGLKSFPKVLLKYIPRYEKALNLNGLTKLSDVEAQCLSKHKGLLLLTGLEPLADNILKILSKHKEIIVHSDENRTRMLNLE